MNSKSRRVLHLCAEEAEVGLPLSASASDPPSPIAAASFAWRKSLQDPSEENSEDSEQKSELQGLQLPKEDREGRSEEEEDSFYPEEEEEEDDEPDSSFFMPSIDQHIANLHGAYQGIDIPYTPFVILSTFVNRSVALVEEIPNDHNSEPLAETPSISAVEEATRTESSRTVKRRNPESKESGVPVNFLRKASATFISKKEDSDAEEHPNDKESARVDIPTNGAAPTLNPSGWKISSSPEYLQTVPFVLAATTKSSEASEPHSDELHSKLSSGATPQLASNPWRSLILVSGSDQKLHAYLEETESSQNEGQQKLVSCIDTRISDFLPELEALVFPSCVLDLDIKYLGDRRLIAIGCQDGTLILTVSQVSSEVKRGAVGVRVLTFTSSFLDGLISTVRFIAGRDGDVSDTWTLENHPFASHSRPLHPLFNKVSPPFQQNNAPTEKKLPKVHLIAGSPVGYAILYEDVLSKQLESPIMLPESESYDSISCCETLCWQTHQTIVLGTYSGALLSYEETPQNWRLGYVHQLAAPVVGLRIARLHSHGAPTLIATTAIGVHFLEFSNEFLSEIVTQRLHYFEERQELLRQLSELQSQRTDPKEPEDSPFFP